MFRFASPLVRSTIVLLAFIGLSKATASTLDSLPSVSSPGTEVIVRGDGHPASTLVDIELVDEVTQERFPLGTSFVDDTGRLFQRVVIPDSPRGAYLLRTSFLDDPIASTTLELIDGPAIRLSPREGAPGETVNVFLGPISAGRVTVDYDGVPVLGPVQHPGGPLQATFLVPNDRPATLGDPVEVRATQVVAGSIAATATTSFLSLPEVGDEVDLVEFSDPGKILSPGERFTTTGRVQVPANRSPSDYEWTAAVRARDGRLIPVNINAIEMDGLGNFTIEAIMPSIASGQGYVELLPTTEYGLVYRIPGLGNSSFLTGVVIEYQPFEVQNLSFNVVREDDQTPVEDVVITVYANTLFVPPGWNYEEDGFPDVRAPTTLQKPVWSAAYAAPNQYHAGLSQAYADLTQGTNEITGCPLTLNSGLTDSNGNWQTNAVPWLNWFLDRGAAEISAADINTNVNGPGKATFTARVGAVHLGLGLGNDGGICTGQEFEFQFDYDTDTWKFRNGPGGDFDLAFNPNEAFPIEIPDCGALPVGIPADPHMPGLTSQKFISNGEIGRRFGAIWSFPDTNGANLIINDVPQLRLPHASDVFGLLDDPVLYIDNVEIGPLTADVGCGNLEYSIDLPQLATFPPGLYNARIEASLLGSTPVNKLIQFDIRRGPTWINQTSDYTSRVIQWSPSVVSMVASEPERMGNADSADPGFGIGDLDNDNMTDGFVSQILLPSGAADRKRVGGATSQAASQPNDPVGREANGSGSSPNATVSFGSMSPITVLDTGKIPLFRYTWGIPPIAAASMGADIWFRALYRYFGEVAMTNNRVLIDATAEAIAQAGLDLWLDASIVLDLVSLSAFALPNFELTMPLVITENEFDAQASQPCFDFAIDVSWEVQVGWCPFCVKGGDLTNLFEVLEGNCPARAARAPRTTPVIPPIDRTSLAVDGLGQASMLWGDGSGDLLLQVFNNGIANPVENLTVGPGAMGATHAYFDTGKSVMVWSQSGLSAAAFLALDGDPADPQDGDFNTAMANQHLAYRVNDGNGWSTPMSLTSPSGGDGGVVLAACPATDTNCPVGGEVLAVWVHDASGNINLHDLRLKYAFFDGLNWGPIQDMDSGSSAKDLQPTATYVDGEPVVFWVRNPSVTNDGMTASYDLNQRRLAYRFLRSTAGVQVPSSLPLGVASPSVEAFDNSVVVAFSVATEADAFLGTRRSLHTATGTACSNGTCQFASSIERTDNGRQIYVEKPTLTRNENGFGVITFRQLGVENATISDPEGVLKNTGALMQLIFEAEALPPPISTTSTPFELSTFGAVNWRVDSIFDPASNSVLTSAVQVGASTRDGKNAKPPPPGVKSRRLGTGGATLLMVERPMLPEFEVIFAEPESSWVPEGSSTDLNVTIRNNGTDWEEPIPVTVATFWDGPPGLGLPGPVETVGSLTSGVAANINLTLPLPEGFRSDDAHTLYVVINPQGELSESDASNNSFAVSIGALPVPTGLTNIDGDISGNIVIHWDPVDDPRVTGYRVYRQNPDGSVLNVGMSPVAGFADFSAGPRRRYSYYVTSVSDRLMESEPSLRIDGFTLDPDELFRDDFE
jgi:hypothetical protein